jgi:predicted phage baseplate assembly protein
MNSINRIRIYLPEMGKYIVNNSCTGCGCVSRRSRAEKHQGMQPYDKSPPSPGLCALGRTVQTTHAQLIPRERLGQSDGSPGQRFQLQRMPILRRQPDEHLIVQVENEEPQVWEEVSDFAGSHALSRHYTLDSVTGELRFGPAVSQPDGTVKLFGAVPPRNAYLIFSCYRFGGGNVGNVQEGALNTLKTAIPFVDRVANREAAWGGLDAETLESAMVRAPAMLRTRERAVSESDFEFLACQALPAAIGRVSACSLAEEAGRVAPARYTFW